VDAEVATLASVGLLDDEAFARAAVEEATGRRLQGRRAVVASLSARGVDRAVIERALEEGAGDEAERAAALARARVTRLAGLAPDVAARRLSDLLMRRGYAPAIARRAAAAALAVDPDPDDA
jgi:regulatory protein